MIKKNKKYTKIKYSTWKYLVVSALVLVSALGISEKLKFTDFVKIHKQNSTANIPVNTSFVEPSTEQKTDLSPATSTDNQDSTAKKESDVTSPTPTPSLTTNPVFKGTVVLTRWTVSNGNLLIRGIVSNVTSGTCTAAVVSKLDSTKVTQSADVRNTGTGYDCGVIDIPLSKLKSNEYSVVLKLSSGENSAESDTQSITIQ